MVDIYKWLFGARGKAAMDDLAEDASGLLSPYLEDIARTERPIIAIEVGSDAPQRPEASSLGGLAWWPASRSYPRDAKGHPLHLLVQLNFADMPSLEPFPSKGLLQIFIAADDLYGCNFEDPARQEGFCCVYHAEIDQAPLSARDNPVLKSEPLGYLPLENPSMPLALRFSLGRMAVDCTDYRFEKLLPEIAADDALRDAYCDFVQAPALRLGGYPTFTQEDPRAYNDAGRYGDFTLLTVDTTDGIMWGDSGVAQFFMHEADLRRGDFSRVAYNWDCC